MARLRYNGLVATLGASLTNSATSVTFAAALTHSGGTAVPTITGSDYIPLVILDSNGVESEIVNLTAYTSGATTGTISRGQEGSTASAQASGAKVVHGPTVADFTGLAGSLPAASTRPNQLLVVQPALGSIAAYSTALMADSPWGFWKQAETSGTTLADASGNSRTLNITGSAATLGVSGPDDALAISWANAAGSASTTGTFAQPTTVTYTVWVYLTAYPTTDSTIMTFGGGGSSGPTSGVVIQAGGRVSTAFYSGGAASISSPTPLSLNTWHHIVVSVGAGGGKLRIDKTTVATNSNTSVSSVATGQFWVRSGGPNGLSGTAAVTIALPAAWYNFQLTDARTDAHYNAMGGGPPSLYFSDGSAWFQLAQGSAV